MAESSHLRFTEEEINQKKTFREKKRKKTEEIWLWQKDMIQTVVPDAEQHLEPYNNKYSLFLNWNKKDKTEQTTWQM